MQWEWECLLTTPWDCHLPSLWSSRLQTAPDPQVGTSQWSSQQVWSCISSSGSVSQLCQSCNYEVSFNIKLLRCVSISKYISAQTVCIFTLHVWSNDLGVSCCCSLSPEPDPVLLSAPVRPNIELHFSVPYYRLRPRAYYLHRLGCLQEISQRWHLSSLCKTHHVGNVNIISITLPTANWHSRPSSAVYVLVTFLGFLFQSLNNLTITACKRIRKRRYSSPL